MMTDAFDSIIFDIDGTLWDSTAEVAKSWSATCERAGIPAGRITRERLLSEFGKVIEDIAYSLFPDLPPEEAVELAVRCGKEENSWLLAHRPPLYPGVSELFRTLKERGFRIFIISNCTEGYIDTLTEIGDLRQYIEGQLCPADTGLAKAGNIKKGVRDWQCGAPVYIGDTMGDYQAAKEAGVPFIFASYGFGSVPEAETSIAAPLGLLSLPAIQKGPRNR